MSSSEPLSAEVQTLPVEGAASYQTYPLTYNQKALLALEKAFPKIAARNLFIAVRIGAQLEKIAFRRAWQKIGDRHPILRTNYSNCSGKILPELHPTPELNIQLTDASSWSEDSLKEQILLEANQPLNLEKEVFRLHLFARSAKESILLLTLHQIAGDWRSFDLLLDDFQKIYTAETARISEQPPNITYTEFGRWQSEILSSSRGEQLREYWQKQLAGELPILNLPADKPRSSIQSDRTETHLFKLDEKLIARLQEVAASWGESLDNILLAAFLAQLYRYTQQEDILAGLPMNTRTSRDEFKEIVGNFVNPVVLRATLAENTTFKDLLAQVSGKVKKVRKFQDYPFALLVERLQIQPDKSRSPLFQVSFTWHEQHGRDRDKNSSQIQEKRLQIEPYLLGHQPGAAVDLDLTVIEASENLQFFWHYNTDLFEPETIARMALNFQTLLAGIVANPERKIRELPLLTAAERHQLLVEWNNTQTDYPRDKCIHQLFEAQVERSPDAIAVIFEDKQLTYRELNARANQLAHYLKNLGVKPEMPVGIYVERSLEMVVGLLGILKAGGAYVPLDPMYPRDRIACILSDSGVKILLTEQKMLALLPEQKAQLIDIDADWGKISQQSQSNPDSSANSDNLAYIIYTSGSTGNPKGVQISHQSLVNFLNSMREAPGLTKSDTLLAVTTICFDIAALEIYLPLLVGAKIVLASREIAANGDLLLSKLLSCGATVLQATPATWRLLLAAGWESSPPLKMLCGGEALPRELADTLLEKGASLWNMYGPTETTVWSTICRVNALDLGRQKHSVSESIGRPIANTEIYILDGNLQPVPVGIVGELHVGGDGLARGYLNCPELNAEKFISHPFSDRPEARLYKTGDLARYLPDGNIEYLGRIDNQVKIRGFRIELGEIETALNSHPQVRESVAIAREDIPGDKRLVAYFVPECRGEAFARKILPQTDSLSAQMLRPYKNGTFSAPTSSELRRFLKERLPEYMVPSAFVTLDALPQTPNGKIDRRALPAPSEMAAELQNNFVAPRDIWELQLAQIWEKVLNLNAVGVKDNFFEIGGHSLLVVRLFAEIEKQFRQSLPLTALFQGETVEELAGILRQGQSLRSWSPLVEIQPKGSKRPFFCVHPVGGERFLLLRIGALYRERSPFLRAASQRTGRTAAAVRKN